LPKTWTCYPPHPRAHFYTRGLAAYLTRAPFVAASCCPAAAGMLLLPAAELLACCCPAELRAAAALLSCVLLSSLVPKIFKIFHYIEFYVPCMMHQIYMKTKTNCTVHM